MAEILTESFCERCGSRYTFESAVPRARLRGMKVLSRGLKNFVLDDKTSIDEAMAAARDDTDRVLTSQQLEAFHKTFNFCMQCRQYICPNCWNDAEGQCLTCAPTLGRGILPAPFPHLDPAAGMGAPAEDGLAAAAMNGHRHASEGPDGLDATARLDLLTNVTVPPPAPPEMVGESEVEARAEAEPEVETTSPEPAPGVAPAGEVATAEAVAAPALETPLVEPEAERFIYDPYDPPVEPAPSKAAVVSEPLAEIVAEPVAESSEPAAVASIDEHVTTQEAPAEPVAAQSEEVDETPDRARTAAASASLLLAGLRPGESLDDAIAAFEAAPDEPEPQPGSAAPPVSPDAPAELPEAPAALEALDDAPVPEDVAIAAEPSDETLVAEEPIAGVTIGADAALAETVSYVEPLDEIPTGEPDEDEPAVAASTQYAPLVPVEPLDDITPAEPVLAEPVAAEPVVAEPSGAELAAIAAVVTEPVIAEPVVAEPVAAEPVVETAPEPATRSVPEPLEVAAAAAAIDIVAQPTWSIVAPDPTSVTEIPAPIADRPSPVVEPPTPAAQVAPSAEPSWPVQPQWPSQQASSTGLPFLGRPAVPTGGVDALWAESDRAVSAPRVGTDKPSGGVQPCTSCGLSLSASARFCRRCGTSQVG